LELLLQISQKNKHLTRTVSSPHLRSRLFPFTRYPITVN